MADTHDEKLASVVEVDSHPATNINTASSDLIELDNLLLDDDEQQQQQPPSPVTPEQKKLRRSRLKKALLCLVGLVLVWVAMAELAQTFQHNQYDKPFMITWFAHSLFVLYMIPWYYLGKREGIQNPLNELKKVSQRDPHDFNRRIVITASVLCVLLFACLYFWFQALPRVSVSSSMVIYNTQFLWVYVFSFLFLREKITNARLISMLFCFLGVIGVASSGSVYRGQDAVDEGSSVLGYIMAIFSTVFFGVYEVVYSRFAINPKNPSLRDCCLFLGILGFVNLVALWPLIGVWSLFSFEKFEMFSASDFGVLVLNGLLDTAYAGLLVAAILYSSPIFVSIGEMLTLPTAMFFDLLFHHGYVMPLVGFLGVTCVFIGFVVLNLEEMMKFLKLKVALSAQLWLFSEKKYPILEMCRLSKFRLPQLPQLPSAVRSRFGM